MKPDKLVTPDLAMKAVAHRALRACMRTRGYSWADVSRLTGVPVGTLKKEDALRWPGRLVRVKIESNLGCRIFSTPSAYRKRQEERALLAGLCPVCATRAELRALARRVGVPNASGFANRREFLRALLARCAVVRPESIR